MWTSWRGPCITCRPCVPQEQEPFSSALQKKFSFVRLQIFLHAGCNFLQPEELAAHAKKLWVWLLCVSLGWVSNANIFSLFPPCICKSELKSFVRKSLSQVNIPTLRSLLNVLFYQTTWSEFYPKVKIKQRVLPF